MNRIVFLWMLAACTGGATPGEVPQAARVPTVEALSAPAAWLVERVGGERVSVENIVPAGEDAATWAPSGVVVVGLAEADLIVANGAGYETWTKTATLPTAKLVDTARGLDLVERQGQTHSHGKQGAHSHVEVDPHTWTDPAIFAQQAAAVHAALIRVYPAGKADFDANLAAVTAELEAVGAELDAALAAPGSRAMIAGHPSFRYLARRVGASGGTAPAHGDLDPLDGTRGGADYDYVALARANAALLRAAAAPVDAPEAP